MSGGVGGGDGGCSVVGVTVALGDWVTGSLGDWESGLLDVWALFCFFFSVFFF